MKVFFLIVTYFEICNFGFIQRLFKKYRIGQLFHTHTRTHARVRKSLAFYMLLIFMCKVVDKEY